MCSPRAQSEIDRLRINLDAPGEKRDKSVSVKQGHSIEGVTGDSVKVFKEGEGGELGNGSLGLSGAEAAEKLSRELDEAILTAMDSQDYADRTDKGRRMLLEEIALNVRKRAYLNPVRVEGREAERDELKKVEATQRRLEERSKGQPRGLPMTTGNK